MVTLCESPPLVPVTVTEYVPGVELETERVDVPEPPLIDAGLTERVSPETGATLRATVPEKPLTGLTVMVEVLVDPPEVTVKLVGLADTVKS
jgi:hypothetical protein